MSAQTKDERRLMTSGSIGRQLLYFSVPLLLSNFFQLLYNTVDSIIVGNHVGSTALAAVGAATPLISLVTSFFIGLSTGAGVVVARYYGAQAHERTSLAVHTFLSFAALLGLLLSIAGILLARRILIWSGVPDDVLPQAASYLTLYFSGNAFVTVYNAGTGILQAVGDAQHPLYFLAAASGINIVLDLLFVPLLGMGVAGAACATVISQAVSAAMVLVLLVRSKALYKVYPKRLRIDRAMLLQIIRYGIPAGMQQMIVSFSNVVVQSYVNTFGSAVIAGYASANKFDNFLLMPVNSFGLAATTFTGQNLGARRYERVGKGIRTALAMSIATVTLLGAVVFVNADTCVGFFSQEADVIAAGAVLIRIICPFYGILCVHQVLTGALRACGRSHVPMITAVLAFVVYRQVFLALALPRIHDIAVIGWSFSTSWVLGAVLTSTYYLASHCIQREEAASRTPKQP